MSGPAWLAKLEARREVVYPVLVAGFAALVLFPFIGGFGLWDPQEFPYADLARQVAASGDYGAVYDTRPALSVWLSAWGIDTIGVGELGARMPNAVLALAGVLATYALGRRLRGPRAGLVAAFVLAASPLYFFQARQLTTDSGALAGSAIAMLGLTGLAWPSSGHRSPKWMAIDALLSFFGLTLAFFGHGLVLGIAVPAAALAFASTAAAGAGFDDGGEAEKSAAKNRQIGVAVAAGAVCVACFFYWYSSRKAGAYVPALGGAFRAGEPPVTATFDYLVRQVAFGMFPWTALAPLALLRLVMMPRGDRAAWGGLVVLAWALVAYAVGTLWVREMGDLRYTGVVAIALGVGFLVDDLLAARNGNPERVPGAATGLPLLALFVFCAGLQIARDIKEFPEELASVHLLQTIKFPAVLKVSGQVMLLGVVFSLLFALGTGMALRERTPRERLDHTVFRVLARRAMPASLAVGGLLALFLSLWYTPLLSEHFSYKNVFDAYFERKSGNEALGVMGIGGSGPEFYSRGQLTRVNDINAVGDLLAKPERTFVVAPASDICSVQQMATSRQLSYHVPYARNSRYLLYSNRLGAGEADENPLRRMIQRTPPSPQIPLAATLQPGAGQVGEIELIGMDVPASVPVRSTFKMTLYFKVNQKVSTNYQAFVHFDKGSRFQGDHWPLRNICGTSYWQPGDYVIDTFEVTAGDTFTTKGTYEIWAGLFTGGAGNWKNMTVVKGDHDPANRVRLGQLQLR